MANYYSEQQIEKARAMDLLSYMTLMNMRTGRWLAEPMLSLGGVYKPSGDPSKRKVPVALQNMLENHPEVTTIHLHLDNDTAGRAAACNIDDQLKNRYNVRCDTIMPHRNTKARVTGLAPHYKATWSC